MKNRILSSVIALSMILSIIPTNIFATHNDIYSVDNVFSEYENNADTDVYDEDLQSSTSEDVVYVDETQESFDEETSLENQADEELSVSGMSEMPIAGIDVAGIGTYTYSTLEGAVAAANSGDTIKLLADVELTTALSISKEITIDLNGYDIQQTGSASVISVTSGGDLTLEDSDTSRTRYGYWDTTYKIDNTAPNSFDYTELKGGIIYGGTKNEGAGVFIDKNSTFVMTGGNITGNTASSNGGGVCVSLNSTFEMTNGTITGNKAYNGGGIYTNSEMTMTDGTIKNNISTGTGGGIHVQASAFTMTGNATIEDNTGKKGSGIYSLSSTLIMTDYATVTGNTATDDAGGVYAYGGTFTMTGNATITSNTATNGGGVYMYGIEFTIKDYSSIESNTATNGGGVYVNSATFTMEDGTIEKNTATTGNRIYLASATSILKLKVSDSDNATIQGALYTDDADNFDMTVHTYGDVTIDGGSATTQSKDDIAYFTGETWTFDPPEAEISGTTYFTLKEAVEDAEEDDTITLLADIKLETALSISKEITIDLNGYDIQQTGSASVISVTSDGNLTLEDSDTSRTRYGYWDTTYKIDNTAPNSLDYTELNGGIIYGGSATTGGGVYINSGAFTMNAGNIAGNTANNGGGVCVDSGTTFTMNGGIISTNTATSSGGGVYVYNTTFTMNGGTISTNTATSSGGGVYVTGGSSEFTMNGGTISTNTATSSGGGVYVYNGTFTMENGTVEKNTATTSGGGVCVVRGTFTMEDGTIEKNTATTSGGGVYVDRGTFTMEDSTIENNTATTGDRVYLYNSTLILTISPMTSSATIKGYLYTDDDDNYNMTVHTNNSSITIDDTVTTQSIDDIAYFTGETWTFDPPEAEIDGTTYFTLKEAVAAAEAEDKITLLKDVELTTALSIKKEVTIDLNGFDIQQTGSASVISVTSDGDFTLEDSDPNSRTRYGYWDTTYKIDNTAPNSLDYTELKGGIIYGGSATTGGGVYINSGAFTMNGGNIAGNTAEDGGGFYTYKGAFIMNNTSTIVDNTATRNGGGGGGVSVADGTFVMNDYSSIKNNTGYNGGGVSVDEGTFVMNDYSSIENNTATYGGGVFVIDSTVTMNDTSTIENNTATTGDRIYLYNSTLILTISPMTSSATIKGYLYTDDADNFDMTVNTYGDVTIDGNASSKDVGDIAYFTGETWTFDQPSIDLSTIITQPITGSDLLTPTTVTDVNGTTHNVTITWSPNDTTAQADTVYTATVTFDNTLENDQVINNNAGIKVDNQVVTLVFQATEKDTSDLVSILGAKFYSGQLWDTQRSPAYPNTSSTFRLWSLKSPYNHYLKTFDMSNGEYVKFELVEVDGAVQTLSDLNDTSLTNAFNAYSNSLDSGNGVLVREVLYNADGTEKQVLSDYGLVWALGEEGFLYTAFSGYLKYSGGVGTYVTIDARNSNDTIVYIPDSNDPLSEQDIADKKDVVATGEGDNSTPSDTTFDLYGKVVDTEGTTAVPSATVTITYDGFTYTTTTNSDGYFIIPNLIWNTGDYTATVQTSSGEVNTYSGTLADKSDPIMLKYDSTTAGESDVLDLYSVTIDLGSGDGSSTAYSVPSGTVSVIPGESLTVVFGNEVDGYVIDSMSNASGSDFIYTITPTGTTTITATWKSSVISDLDLTDYITAPIKNATPDTSNIDTDQYTGTISWNTSESIFGGNTVYTATVTLIAKAGYTLTGISADSFSHTSATSVSNTANSGEITIVFPITSDKIVSSIEITTKPTTLEYEYGDTIDLTGMVVTATYDDNSKADITDYTVSPETVETTGTVTVTVTVDGVTTTFDVTVSQKTLTITDAMATNRDYDKTTTVEVKGVLNGVVSGDDVSISNTTGTSDSADVGTHSVSDVNFVLTGSDKDKYTLTQPTGLTVTISKATHANETTTGSAKYGMSGSIDLSAWYSLDGASLSLGTITDSDSVLNADISLSSQELNFEFKNSDSLVGKTATVVVNVSSTNYADFTITVTLEILDKLSPNATVGNFEKIYDGNAVTIDDLTKSADVDGSWSLSSNATDVLDSGTYTVTFTPTNTTDYAIVTTEITIKIEEYNLNTSDFDVILDQIYTGSAIEPEIVTLLPNVEYTISYSDNIEIGTATVTITANSNNYSGNIEITFDIINGASSSAGSSANITPTYPLSIENDNDKVDITVSPKNPLKNEIVTITPNVSEGYEISSVIITDDLGNDVEVKLQNDGTYTFIQGSNKVTITIETIKVDDNIDDKVDDFVFPFTDVLEDTYYYDAVLWAILEGITLGKTENSFAPNDINTRAETVMFLWRVFDSPIVDCENPFDDVFEEDYYYQAVLWAVLNGVTVGTSETTFSPNLLCDRSQSITFLYRYVGEPEVVITTHFKDILATDYFYDAVCWGYKNEITFGTDENVFNPKREITRGEFVTFLFRLFSK